MSNANNGPSNVSVDSINNRCDKTCEMLKTMCKSNGKGNTTTSAATSSTPGTGKSTQPSIESITCYKCGNLGQYSTTCPKLPANVKRNEGRGQMRCYSCQGYGHMARNCPKVGKKKKRYYAGRERTRRERTRVAADARSSSLFGCVPRKEKSEFPS